MLRPHRKTHRTILSAMIFSSGLTTDYVAFRTKVSPSHLSGLASGLTTSPSDATLARLAEFFNVSNPPDLLKQVSVADLSAALRAYLLGVH